MTDNEKRAHDLAISYYKEIIQAKIDNAVSEAAENGETNVSTTTDIYQEYKNIYESSLKAFNRDYPDGR